jgi:DNA gyrase subunit A
MAEGEKIIKINIEQEMKSAYIDYSMSVIVSRALPDVRDGLKPVHRRVLYGMLDLGVRSNSPHKKSARIVGEVLGKYHPHGDTSVYDAMVRMAQEWSLRYMLVEGQGNFGSVDGDSPAAMRYTEARLRKIAEEMLSDIDKETVDFSLNFDDSLQEPTVLPSKIPTLLLNGASGIAVGMATNMAPHNLTEVIDGITAYIDNKDIDIDGLMEHIKAPDFPTGGIIYGYQGVKDAFNTGKGRIVMRAQTEMEETNSGRFRIIVSEIPYQVNKADMIKRTADLINDKKLEGISDIRDESDRTGMRIVFELKREAIPNVVLNNLFKHTALQTSFSINNIALVKGRPVVLNLKDIIVEFVEFRHEVVVRRTKYELRKAEERAHILEGLIIASDNIDEVIEIIKKSKTPDSAIENLMERFKLSDIQARAIVDMRLRQLTGLMQDKLRSEYDEIMALITDLQDILSNESRRMQIIKDELIYIKEKYGDDRRSVIDYSGGGDFSIEDMIPDETVVVTISHLGYMKRTSLSEYKLQNRGGVGSKGTATRDADFLEQLFVATTHNYLLVFTEKGKCYWMRVFEIPEGTKQAKGRAIQNLINIESDDKVLAYINVSNLKDENYLKRPATQTDIDNGFAESLDDLVDNLYIIMCTKNGTVKKTSLSAYSRPRTNGINAITIKDGDHLLEAKLTSGSDEIILALKSGKAIRFNESKTRPMGRNASGVRGIRLGHDKDAVVGMITSPDIESANVLVVSENGYGKRSNIYDYRVTNRGGKAVQTITFTDNTGDLIAIKNFPDEDDLMIINKSGIVIRLGVDTLRVMGRATQGVKLINLKGSDQIAAVAKIEKTDDEDVEDAVVLDEEGNPIVNTEENESNNDDSSNENEDGKDVDNTEE